MTNETALTLVDPLRRAVANAESIPDFMAVRDMASAAKAYAKARGMGIDAENAAAEYVLRMERAVGLALTELKAEGRFLQGPPSSVHERGAIRSPGDGWTVKAAHEKISLSDLPVTANQSSQFQRLAAIPEDTFEEMLANVKGAAERLARVKFIGVKRETEAEAESRRIREYNRSIMAADTESATPIFRALARAVDAALAGRGLRVLPDDELAKVATLILALRDAYNEAKTERTVPS